MKIPHWLVGVITTVLTALIIGGFAWAWNINAQSASTEMRVDGLNSSMIEFKGNMGTAFTEINKRFDRIDNKLDRIDRKNNNEH